MSDTRYKIWLTEDQIKQISLTDAQLVTLNFCQLADPLFLDHRTKIPDVLKELIHMGLVEEVHETSKGTKVLSVTVAGMKRATIPGERNHVE